MSLACLLKLELKHVTSCLAGKAWNGWYPPPGYEQSNISNRTLKNAVVTCGKPPSTAPDCSKSSGPCLFDIEQDPCEYVNLASQHEDLVQKLLTKLEEYRNSSVPPRNKHMDPRANPKYHGGAWVPWEDLPQFNSRSLYTKLKSPMSSYYNGSCAKRAQYIEFLSSFPRCYVMSYFNQKCKKTF